MTTSPYGQPEPFGQPAPFDPATIPTQPARPGGSPNRMLLPVVAAVALALVAFAGGYVVANATSSRSTTGANAFTGNNGGPGFGPNSSFRPRNGGAGGFGGGASGTVGSVSADQMTITTQAGGSRIVLLTPTTTVTEVTEATKAVSDLTSGQEVTVIGTPNPDGSVTATQVIVGNVGGLFGGRGGFGRPDGSPAPSAAP
jgi:hypothetical protein